MRGEPCCAKLRNGSPDVIRLREPPTSGTSARRGLARDEPARVAEPSPVMGSGDPRESPVLRVLVADVPEFASELGRVLGRNPLIEVVGVAESVPEAAELIERTTPEVALIGEFAENDLGDLAESIGRVRGLAVILLVRLDQERRGARGAIQAAAFLRREPSAEETLEPFLEVAAFAVATQRTRDADA